MVYQRPRLDEYNQFVKISDDAPTNSAVWHVDNLGRSLQLLREGDFLLPVCLKIEQNILQHRQTSCSKSFTVTDWLTDWELLRITPRAPRHLLPPGLHCRARQRRLASERRGSRGILAGASPLVPYVRYLGLHHSALATGEWKVTPGLDSPCR